MNVPKRYQYFQKVMAVISIPATVGSPDRKKHNGCNKKRNG